MRDLIVSIPDHCLSFYFKYISYFILSAVLKCGMLFFTLYFIFLHVQYGK